MAKVDFYLLQDSSEQAKNLFLCKLIEKIYLHKHQLYIHCQSRQEAHQLDELLWTFKDTSFIPHNLIHEGPNEAPPVQFGFDDHPEQHHDVLINLSNNTPSFYQQFKRILEVFPAHEGRDSLVSERQQHYQNIGYHVTSHSIKQEQKAQQHG